MSTWCDESLAFQEQLVREAISNLAKELDLIEQSVLLTTEVNNESFWDDSHDHYLPQKIASFREYLERLRGGILQLKHVRKE